MAISFFDRLLIYVASHLAGVVRDRGWTMEAERFPCLELNLIKVKGKVRTDSTYVLASIRNLNRLEYVGETLGAALNTLAVVAPDWLSNIIAPDWFELYSKPV